MVHPGMCGPLEWRTLGVAAPGSDGPWKWRTLGVVDPGSGGAWEWRTMGVADPNPFVNKIGLRNTKFNCVYHGSHTCSLFYSSLLSLQFKVNPVQWCRRKF